MPERKLMKTRFTKEQKEEIDNVDNCLNRCGCAKKLTNNIEDYEGSEYWGLSQADIDFHNQQNQNRIKNCQCDKCFKSK
jgi:hypothetical protein